MREKTAFVAMKFWDEAPRDKRFVVICEVLREAGYRPIRADGIRTSGPVVDEVCELLRASDLVLIDSTGDSHSVSYEIGYCHGIRRSTDTTLLIRQGSDIPFNYRHFRHRCYKDLRHLRRLLRDWLNVLKPLDEDRYGYTFTFELSEGAEFYGPDSAVCVLKALKKVGFSGRAEFYAGDGVIGGIEIFQIGMALRVVGKRTTPDYKWWVALRKILIREIEASKVPLVHADGMSEMSSLRDIRGSLAPLRQAQFEKGVPRLILGDAEDETWFQTALREHLPNGDDRIP